MEIIEEKKSGSALDIACKEAGLEKTVSPFALACHKEGLNPEETSFLALAKKRHGVSTLAEAEKVIGKDWIDKITKF